MNDSIDYKQSYWWSSLSEFGEEVLVNCRKRLKLTQQEMALRLGVNQSEVSRIERGLIKPKSVVLMNELCTLYGLSSVEKDKYLKLTTGVTEFSPSIVTGLIENQINSIANLNRSGFPRLAIKQSEDLRSWITSNVDTQDKYNSFLVVKISHLLLEESAAWWDVELPKEVRNYTNDLIKQMNDLSVESFIDQQAIDLYKKINVGFHSYINCDYKTAKQYFSERMPLKEKVNDLWSLEVFRASLITFGKMKDFNLVQGNESEVLKYINDKSVNDISKGYLLEGLARAYSEFDLKKSIELFGLANKFVLEAKKQPNFLNIRHIQLTRSYLDALKREGKRDHKLLNIAEPALMEAEKGGFNRHKNQILTILNT